MKIAILGTNGFLSMSIARYANKQGWEINMYGIDKPVGHKYNTFCKLNLMYDEIDYSQLLDNNIIVYAIGAGIQNNLNEDYDLIYNLNVTVPVTICKQLHKLNYNGIFITFGSYFEIGNVLIKHPFTEEEILTSTAEVPNDYTVSKRMFSRFVSSYKHDFTHWHFFLPTIYGENENPKRLIPYTIKCIMNDEPLQYTGGDQVRQYIYVNEIPQIIHRAFIKQLASGSYNVSGYEILSVRELTTLIHNHFKATLSENCFGSIKRIDTNMKYLALDGTKLEKAIGFKTLIRINDIIDKYRTYIQEDNDKKSYKKDRY